MLKKLRPILEPSTQFTFFPGKIKSCLEYFKVQQSACYVMFNIEIRKTEITHVTEVSSDKNMHIRQVNCPVPGPEQQACSRGHFVLEHGQCLIFFVVSSNL